MYGAIIKGAINLVPMAINTISSVVKDKKVKNVAKELKDGGVGDVIDNVVHKDVAAGLSISSKRAMNVAGTPVLFYLAYQLLAGNNVMGGAIMAGCAVLYTVGLAYVTHLTEK